MKKKTLISLLIIMAITAWLTKINLPEKNQYGINFLINKEVSERYSKFEYQISSRLYEDFERIKGRNTYIGIYHLRGDIIGQEYNGHYTTSINIENNATSIQYIPDSLEVTLYTEDGEFIEPIEKKQETKDRGIKEIKYGAVLDS